MWTKLSLAARVRSLRTPEEERQDARWVANDEAIRVAAERVAKEAEDEEKMEADVGDRYEATDGWYGAAEDAPAPDLGRNAAWLAFHHASEEEADVVHHRSRRSSTQPSRSVSLR
jgi:hypothetical protein